MAMRSGADDCAAAVGGMHETAVRLKNSAVTRILRMSAPEMRSHTSIGEPPESTKLVNRNWAPPPYFRVSVDFKGNLSCLESTLAEVLILEVVSVFQKIVYISGADSSLGWEELRDRASGF